MRKLPLILGVALLTTTALAQERLGREQVFHRHGKPGERVRIFTYTRFASDCRPLSPPSVRIAVQPAHGAVVTEPASTEVRVLTEGAADCTGRTIEGIGVFYEPAPGFRGADRFEYDVLTTPTPRHDIAVVDIH